jgi:hypothetical protein
MADSNLTGNIYNTGAISYDIFYRVKGSNGPWLSGGNVLATVSPAITTPFSIMGIDPQEYEYYFISHCTNGEESVASDTFYSTPICAAPLSFNVNQVGSNFVIDYTVPQSIGQVNLQVLYPNGGTLNQNYGVTNPGQITIPVLSGQYGDYTFSLRSVCNVASGWYSPFANDVLITTINPGPCPPPVIVSFSAINVTTTMVTYRFIMEGYTPTERVVLTNNTTGSQQTFTQTLTSNYFDLPIPRGTVDYNYSVAVFNICTVGVDNIGDIINLVVTASDGTVLSIAGWTVTAGPDIIDINGDGVIGTQVTVNTNGLTPSPTRTAAVQVRFNCSTSGYAYVNINIPPGAVSGVARDWNSECTIDLQSPFINSAYLL